MPDYGNPSYWDERYAAEDGQIFDWYLDYKQLRPILTPYLRQTTDFEILHVGCGNSRLGADLYDDGYRNITNIDTSAVVVNQMSDKYVDREEMEFTVMDVKNMEFLPMDCFNLIIDKGLFDAQLCTDDNLGNVELQIHEIWRVLKSGGIYFIVSHGLPATRLGYLSRGVAWSVEYKEIPRTGVAQGDMSANYPFYAYICKKP